MTFHVRELSTSDPAALKTFITLERKLIGASPLFVSEIDTDVLKCLSGRSKYYSDMEHTLFVAFKDGQGIARCAALINRRFQRAKDEALGFVGYFAAASDSSEAVRGMIEYAEAWLGQRGVTRVLAPFNGSGILGLGVLTAAFDEEPVFPFRWNPPYYAGYLTEAGYAPTYPIWYYTVDFSSDRYRDAERRVAATVPAFTGGVVGPRNDAAVGEELAHRREAFDAVDLEMKREGYDFADTGNPEQALDIGVGDEFGLKLLLDTMDLITQQLDLLRIERRLKRGFVREPKRLGHKVRAARPSISKEHDGHAIGQGAAAWGRRPSVCRNTSITSNKIPRFPRCSPSTTTFTP